MQTMSNSIGFLYIPLVGIFESVFSKGGSAEILSEIHWLSHRAVVYHILKALPSHITSAYLSVLGTLPVLMHYSITSPTHTQFKMMNHYFKKLPF